MRKVTPKRVLVAASALWLAVGAGGAIAASNSSSKNDESFLSRVAGHLGISTEKLEDATEAAAIDQVDEQLKAGRITKAQADELKARIRQGGVPFLFGGRHRFGGPGGFDDRACTTHRSGISRQRLTISASPSRSCSSSSPRASRSQTLPRPRTSRSTV